MSTFQKQSSRNLVLSPNAQAAYGGVLADAYLTTSQRFDPSTVFEHKATNRTDKSMAGKQSEWATDDQITAWESSGTIKTEGDAFFLGLALALLFGQDTVTGAGPYTHTFTLPTITATMPCTTIYTEDTNDQKRKWQDMSAKSLDLTIPKTGAIQASLDLVGTGLVTPGAMVAGPPALIAALYLLGSDVQISITPTGGAADTYTGRNESIGFKFDRATTPYRATGGGLFASANTCGQSKFSVDFMIAAQQTDDINGVFEAGTRCAVTIKTNPANTYQMGLSFPSVRLKASKLGNSDALVMWGVSFDETTCINSGGNPAISAFVVNNTPLYLAPE